MSDQSKQRNRIDFCRGRKAWRRLDWLGYRVRLFSRCGQYITGTIRSGDSLIYADKDVTFSVVRSGSWNRLDPGLPYSEVNHLTPEELRFFASLLLCEKRDEPCVRLYPVGRHPWLLDSRRIRLDRPDVVMSIKELILRELPNAPYGHRDRAMEAKPYELIEQSCFALDRLDEFMTGLASYDYVVLRGMHALMKADMLNSFDEFGEEAVTSCFVALDASYAYIKGLLEYEGFKNATAEDAAKWLHVHFDAAFGIPSPAKGERYFGDMYMQRVQSMHPKNRSGEFPYAPLLYDDYMYLRRTLREIFGYLVTARHGQDYVDDVNRHACTPADRIATG